MFLTTTREQTACAVVAALDPGLVATRTKRREDETVVRDALRAITAAPTVRPAAPPPVAGPRSQVSRGRVFVIGMLVLFGTGVAFVALQVAPSQSSGCEPITYAFVGSPPGQTRAEFQRAVREIHRASGLGFQEQTPATGKLHVVWSEGPIQWAPSPVVSGGIARIIGYGHGHWRDGLDGYRQLASAEIEIDATAPWSFGIDRHDGLAAVFVHELGHVVGLTHKADPASFMYPVTSSQVPQWTNGDRVQLISAGKLAGCTAPTLSTRSAGKRPRLRATRHRQNGGREGW